MPVRDVDTRIGFDRPPIDVTAPGGSTVVVVDRPGGGGASPRYARRPLLGGISTATIFGLVLLLAPLVLLFQYFPGDRGKMKQLEQTIAAKDAAIAQQTQRMNLLNTQVAQMQSQIAAGQAQQQKMTADIKGAMACMQPLNAYGTIAPTQTPTPGGQQ